MNNFHSRAWGRLAIVWSLAALVAPLPYGGAAKAASPDTVYVIPHTHWEGAVFKTREEYLEMLRLSGVEFDERFV